MMFFPFYRTVSYLSCPFLYNIQYFALRAVRCVFRSERHTLYCVLPKLFKEGGSRKCFFSFMGPVVVMANDLSKLTAMGTVIHLPPHFLH